MKVAFKVVGITFAVKDSPAVRKLVPSGQVELRHTPFVHATDPSQNDPNAVTVWNQGVQIGYVPKNSNARAAFFEMLSEGVDINATVTGFKYAVYDGNLNIVDDTFNDNLDGYLASVEVEFEAAVTSTHYTIGGKRYMRVTCVANMLDEVGMQVPEHLYKWMTETDGARITHADYCAKLEATRMNGTKLHKACEDFVRFGVPSVDTPFGLSEFVAKFGVQYISSEQVVFDKQYGVAGRYDLLASAIVKDAGRKKLIIDWKRGSKVRLGYLLQCAFYAKKTKADGFWIVLFGTGNKCGYSVKQYTKKDVDYLYTCFCSMAALMEWLGEYPEGKKLLTK